jgi:hypothetical protein
MKIARPKQLPASASRSLMGSGHYWLYENPDGSAVVEWNDHGGEWVEGAVVDGQQEIPAPVWQILKSVAEGKQLGPQAVLRLLAGGRLPRRGLD